VTTSTRQFPATLGRIKQAVAEMNYAQRRLFELRTGVPDSRSRRQIEHLEALFRAKAI
jgi:hypothetical protein